MGGLRVNARRAVIVGLLLVVGITVLAIYGPASAEPPETPPGQEGQVTTKTIVVTQTVAVTPTACNELVTDTDAFLGVTNKFLDAGNAALDALISFDDKMLGRNIDKMRRLQHRYDEVMNRYMDSRAGCL